MARRLALRARQQGRNRREREASVGERPPVDLLDELTVREAQLVLDEELARLPERERGPLLLCYLQGLTRDEAAQRLGCPLGTLKHRLARAREVLQRRLSRRGVAMSAVLATLLLTRATASALPGELATATVRAGLAFAGGSTGGGAVGPKAAALAEGALRSALVGKVKIAVVCLALALACVGLGLASSLHLQRPVEGQIEQAVAPPNERANPPGQPPIDWPQWRGPNRDGVVHGAAVPAQWPKALKEEWQATVGEGVASPVVVGGNVYVFARQKNDEVVLCLDLAGGKEVWRSEPYPAPYNRGPQERNFSKGPRSTPAVAGARVYTLGLSGILSCLDARTGTLLWRKNCKPDPAAPPAAAHDYGGASPLVADGLCIVHVGDGTTGGLTAFDALTGEVKWRHAEGYSPMSGSPILVDLAGARQVVTYSSSNAAGVSAATGTRLWGVGSDGVGQPHTTPVRYKDLLILNDILKPLRALRLEKGDDGITAKEVWKAAKGLPMGYSSPVLAGDLVFGMSTRKNGCFFCLDAASGETLWESKGGQGDYASILNAGSVLLFLTESGRLLVVRPSGAAYEPIAEYRVSDTDTHAHPVFLGDRLLIKDATTLRSFRIEPDGGKW